MKAVLDSGAFIGIDKNDRTVIARLRVIQQLGIDVWTSSAVVAHVWRDGRKQAALARILAGIRVRALGPGDDRACGELLAATRTTDIVDAHVALCADEDDQLWTGDPDDMKRLLDARQQRAQVVAL